MTKPMLYLDFNRMFDHELFLLSSSDIMTDANGKTVTLHEGLQIAVYDEDMDNNGQIDNLVAEGVVERNATGWNNNVKWCCRIDKKGVRHQSEIK